MTVANVIEVIGKSAKSWDDAAQSAVREISKKYKNICCVEVVGQTANVNKGKIIEFKSTLKIVYL